MCSYLSSGSIRLIFGLALQLFPYLVCPSSKGYGETEQSYLSLKLVADVIGNKISFAGSNKIEAFTGFAQA